MRIFVLQGPLSWSALQGLDDFPRSCQRLYGGGVDLEAKLRKLVDEELVKEARHDVYVDELLSASARAVRVDDALEVLVARAGEVDGEKRPSGLTRRGLVALCPRDSDAVVR